MGFLGHGMWQWLYKVLELMLVYKLAINHWDTSLPSFYTMEIGKHCKSGLLLLKSWLFNI